MACRKVQQYLAEAQNRICVLENALASANDPVLRKLQTKYATYDNEVYHLLFQEDAQEERILQTIKLAKSIPAFIGVLSTWQEGPLDTSRSVLSLGHLQSIANNARKLIIGAYDGEGYLIWSR